MSDLLNQKMEQITYKPGSVSLTPEPAGDDGYSSWRPVTRHLMRPTRTSLAGSPALKNSHAPIWSCFGWGLPCQVCHQTRGALLPPLFTLTRLAVWRFVFCGTFPRVAPAGRYPAS